MSTGKQTNTRRSWVRYVLERRSASALGLILIVAIGLIGWAQPAAFPNGFASLIVMAIVLYEFQKRLDQGVPLIQLTAVIAVVQWLVGPALSYGFNATYEYDFERYAMSVTPETYFRFAMPATCFYSAIMLATGASVRQQNLLSVVNRRHFVLIGFLLTIVGNAATSFAPAGGGGLAFLFHLIGQVKYVGALYFLMSRHQLKLVFASISMFQLAGNSIGSGLFHDLLLWLMIVFCFWFAQREWSVPAKFIFLSLACAAVFSIQVVKLDYRERIRRGQPINFFEMTADYLSPSGKAWETDSFAGVITRLNQGWIISNVLYYVPNDEPFAEGETIKDAVVGALVPRIIYADKKKAGGQENFTRFTGLRLEQGTSMAISPLGEAYANFGEFGGILFMIVYGAFFALFFFAALKYSTSNPTFLLWIPLIFYQAIKAETEVVVVLNQLTKGALIAVSAHFVVRQLFYPKVLSKLAASRPAPPRRTS